MKRIQFYKEEGVYLARCCASANTLFFERKPDHELFFRLADKYLSGMIEVIHYSLIPTGWILIFKTKSAAEIETSYWKQREKSTKAISVFASKSIGRMISEHFRFLNSQYVKLSNANSSRHGSKVHSRFQKFVFKDEKDINQEIERIETLSAFMQQWIEPYWVDLGLYDVEGMEELDSVERSSKRYNSKTYLKNNHFESFVGIANINDVVQKLVSTTHNNHFPLKPPEF